ncbi:hypothetical protein JAAARDRAFT_143089 [Jaapia argillacea MUCL 33604]|uniref:Uncharacterized protein n=1 Tax=Jaapia argillacea MUCL 33604 TaxID=933084 RepID=A0A067PGN4_9AGAM|nr:hypothetical protein JAAARDRAFT_143089 [Jaapia argillacea MUCL 33604]
MSSAHYQVLPTDDDDDRESVLPGKKYPPSATPAVLHDKLKQDPRFNPPTPSVWTRLLLLFFVVFLFWLGYQLRFQKGPEDRVVHAQRYSRDYKFRPAASPIITERLKDGKVRVRGAQPSRRY